MVRLFLEILQHILDAHRGHRIDGDGELVEQQQGGFLREGARDGESLLLSAAEQAAQRVQAILDLVPQRRAAQAALDDDVEVGLVLDAADARRERHVVVDAHRQSDRQREHDTHLATQAVQVAPCLQVGAVVRDRTAEVHARDLVVHAVEHAQGLLVLPLPAGPMIPKISFLRMSRLTLESAGTPSWVMVRSFTSRWILILVYHFRLPRRYIRNAMDTEFITRTMPMRTSATP